MAGRKAIKKKSIEVPKDRDELGEYLAKMNRAEGMIRQIEAEASEKVSKLSIRIKEIIKEAQEKARPFEVEINERAKGVHIFAEARRKELTKDGLKTVGFPTGDMIRWYFPRPSVVAKDKDAAIAELKSQKLTKAIRVIEEINKEWILDNKKRVEGFRHISISQEEIFAIVLFAFDIELQKGERKFKKVDLKKEKK